MVGAWAGILPRSASCRAPPACTTTDPDRPPPTRCALCRSVKDAEKTAEGVAAEGGCGLKSALFGVLYTLAKEKISDSAAVALANIIIDFVLIVLLFITPHYQWAFRGDEW